MARARQIEAEEGRAALREQNAALTEEVTQLLVELARLNEHVAELFAVAQQRK